MCRLEQVSRAGVVAAASLPLLALGASSGGTFVSLLPLALPVVSIAVYISPGHPHVLGAGGSGSVPALCGTSVRAAAWLYMAGDGWATSAAATAATTSLQRCPTPVHTRVFAVESQPLTLDVLRRVHNLEPTVSARLLELLDREV